MGVWVYINLERSHDEHGMQANETTLHETPRRHLVPSINVSIADDEAREHEEEVDGQIAVVDVMRKPNLGANLEKTWISSDLHSRAEPARSTFGRFDTSKNP